jgi:hypothetical protein
MYSSQQHGKSNSYMPHRRSHIHHWWREIYNLDFFSDKIELPRVHHDFEADVFFPEINPSDWEISLNSKKMRNTYLITPIKRTLEKKHPQQPGVFLKQ